MQHGTLGSYTNLHCRCDPCRAANAEYYRRRNQERYALTAAGQCGGEHGRAATYTNWGCRCDACTAANTKTRYEFRSQRTSDG